MNQRTEFRAPVVALRFPLQRHVGRRIAMAAMGAALLLSGCSDQTKGADAASSQDHGTVDLAHGTTDLPADAPAGADSSPAQDTGQAADLISTCATCLLEQVCVHFINSTTCAPVKLQCKDRTPACYSPSTNPCSDCEAQVCGAWSSSTLPAGCSAPTPGSFDPAQECFCYSK